MNLRPGTFLMRAATTMPTLACTARFNSSFKILPIMIVMSFTLAASAIAAPRPESAQPIENPEVIADCIVFERIDPPVMENAYLFSKFHVRLADGRREVRTVAVNVNEKFRDAKVGDRLCARPVVTKSTQANR